MASTWAGTGPASGLRAHNTCRVHCFGKVVTRLCSSRLRRRHLTSQVQYLPSKGLKYLFEVGPLPAEKLYTPAEPTFRLERSTLIAAVDLTATADLCGPSGGLREGASYRQGPPAVGSFDRAQYMPSEATVQERSWPAAAAQALSNAWQTVVSK